jgi:hypothetical protein
MNEEGLGGELRQPWRTFGNVFEATGYRDEVLEYAF